MTLITIHDLYHILGKHMKDINTIEISKIRNIKNNELNILYYITINNSEIYALHIAKESNLTKEMFYSTFIPDIIRDLKNDNILVTEEVIDV